VDGDVNGSSTVDDDVGGTVDGDVGGSFIVDGDVGAGSSVDGDGGGFIVDGDVGSAVDGDVGGVFTVDGDVGSNSTVDGDDVSSGSTVYSAFGGRHGSAADSTVSINVDNIHVSNSGASSNVSFSLLFLFHFCITGCQWLINVLSFDFRTTTEHWVAKNFHYGRMLSW